MKKLWCLCLLFTACSKDVPKAFLLNVLIENRADNSQLSDDNFSLTLKPQEEGYIDFTIRPIEGYRFSDISNITLEKLPPNTRFSKGWSIAHNHINYRLYFSQITENQNHKIQITGFIPQIED